ncbi:hypothetical protein ACNO8X_23825 [Mycobacterium sp. PDNC021]|uniref:hypothetical protein n=1 Tax=Mycobacterium sp. PDNC021 TaxID=3391399 RepID=UPI003AAFE4B1
MPLPLDARQRLAAPLRNEMLSNAGFRDIHSLPVSSQSWAFHSTALSSVIAELATASSPQADGFAMCRQRVAQVQALAGNALSMLLAIQPFVPFDRPTAERLVVLIAGRMGAVADGIEGATDVAVDAELLAESERWSEIAGVADARSALGDAFAMSDPPIDDAGRFRPEWVFQHYAYRLNDLMSCLLPHLASLGVPGLRDALTAVTVVGEILACDDSVGAYVHMDALIGSFLTADPATKSQARQHLTEMEPAIHRARDAAARSWHVVRDVNAENEIRANALADCYKRLVEGPFRQFAWAYYCLNMGSWQRPPMLGVLRDRMVAVGGGHAEVASHVVIPELRNGEAHETVVWDGFAEHYSTEGVHIPPDRVVASTQIARSFVAGCEAAIAVVRFLDLPTEIPPLPLCDEEGRMPAWRRVQAFFGTNGMRLHNASLNTRHASLQVNGLLQKDVNPCFQALVLAHRLMPNIESFSVGVADSEPTIVVTVGALAACMPAWELAVSNLDKIPLSTFLPANLDARLEHEPDSVAVRSVAWIAVDDVLDAIDGSPATWTDVDRRLLDVRLNIVELSAQSTERSLDSHAARLESVAESVASLREWICDESPNAAHLAERKLEMVRLRAQWESWGPVPRHPLIAIDGGPGGIERQPGLQKGPKLPRYHAF